jgi:hypothetical protein
MKCMWMVLSFALCALCARAADVALQNPGFETVDPSDAAKATGWNPFSETAEPPAISISSEDAQEGAHCMRIGFSSKKDGFVGLLQEVAVEPGQKLKFSGQFKKVDIKEGSYLKLGIEWKRADGTELSRVQDGDINAKTLASGNWIQFEVAGVAPSACSKAVFTITFYTGGISAGAVLTDSMALELVNK